MQEIQEKMKESVQVENYYDVEDEGEDEEGENQEDADEVMQHFEGGETLGDLTQAQGNAVLASVQALLVKKLLKKQAKAKTTIVVQGSDEEGEKLEALTATKARRKAAKERAGKDGKMDVEASTVRTTAVKRDNGKYQGESNEEEPARKQQEREAAPDQTGLVQHEVHELLQESAYVCVST